MAQAGRKSFGAHETELAESDPSVGADLVDEANEWLVCGIASLEAPWGRSQP